MEIAACTQTVDQLGRTNHMGEASLRKSYSEPGPSCERSEQLEKRAKRAAVSYLLYPQWGIDSYSLYKYRLQKFLSNFNEDSPDNPANAP